MQKRAWPRYASAAAWALPCASSAIDKSHCQLFALQLNNILGRHSLGRGFHLAWSRIASDRTTLLRPQRGGRSVSPALFIGSRARFTFHDRSRVLRSETILLCRAAWEETTNDT